MLHMITMGGARAWRYNEWESGRGRVWWICCMLVEMMDYGVLSASDSDESGRTGC